MDCQPKRSKGKRAKKKKRNELDEAKAVAFRFLSYRPRSMEEVKRKLSEKEFSPLTVKKTLARLNELGYLNDYEYAHSFARSSVEGKKWGALRIHAELIQKGIANNIIDHTITQIKREYDELQVARQALETKFAQSDLYRPVDEKTRNKFTRFLRRKGFDWNTIYSVINPRDDVTI